MDYEERVELAIKFNKKIIAGLEVNKINVDNMLKADELVEGDLDLIIELYPKWSDLIGTTVEKGKILQYEGRLYRVIKGLTLLENWKPNEVASEFNPIFPENIIAEWEQRYGHNPYEIGDKVVWRSKIYVCKINNTTHNPDQAPQNWEPDTE